MAARDSVLQRPPVLMVELFWPPRTRRVEGLVEASDVVVRSKAGQVRLADHVLLFGFRVSNYLMMG